MRTNSQILSAQQRVPDAHRQSCIMLEFRDPVPEHRMEEFHRIHLNRVMLGAGEDDYYMADYHQPEKSVENRRCAACGESGTPLSLDTFMCCNRRCASYQVAVTIAKRGVVKCWVFPDWIVADEEVEFEDGSTATYPLTNRVLLALDRRYSDQVLSQVKRTAEALAEMLFMPLKG